MTIPVIDVPANCVGVYELYFVYAYRAIGVNSVKVGCSRNPIQRGVNLRSSCPVPVEWVRILMVPDRKSMMGGERLVHERLAEYRTHGEWFRDGPHVHDAMDEICPAVDVTDGFNATTDNCKYKDAQHPLQVLSERIYSAGLAA